MAGPTVPAPGAARLLRARAPRTLGRGGVSGRETRAMTRQTSASVMTCQDVLERVDLYLDRALRPAERRAVEAHLLVCAGCRAAGEAAAGVVTRLRNAIGDEAPPHHLWSRIAAHLRADNIRAQRVERRPSVWRLSRREAIAASALFAIGIVFAGRRLMTTD